jgi:hypothetical protein
MDTATTTQERDMPFKQHFHGTVGNLHLSGSEATPAPAATKHTCGGPVFGKLTPGCPRCDELAAGAPPRQLAYTPRPESDDARRAREIREHNCRTAGCGPVCTFGQW